MAIHHDKMAYGKLDNLTEKLTDDKLAAMAKLLSQNIGDKKSEDADSEEEAENQRRGKCVDDNKK